MAYLAIARINSRGNRHVSLINGDWSKNADKLVKRRPQANPMSNQSSHRLAALAILIRGENMKLFLILYDAVGLVAAVSHPLSKLDKCHQMAGDIFVYYKDHPQF